MAAKRYTLRLYRKSKLMVQEDTNIDPNDTAFLRKTLERLVEAKTGTLKLDLSEWSMVVHRLGGGMIRLRVVVTPSGDTEIKSR